MKISICTQIKNRLHQFKQTYPINIKTLSQYNNVEWIIVDINSDDKLYEYMKNNLEKNNVHYFRTSSMFYSIPVAKNFAARLSTGDYIFNLDADNFLGSIISTIQDIKYIGVHCDIKSKGVYGRIGCLKHIYKAVGGYDESFLPAAHHEQDFIFRCKLLGYNFLTIRDYILPIQNTKEDTISNINSKLSWQDMNAINKIKTINNFNNDIINPNTIYYSEIFEYNFISTKKLSMDYA